MKKRMQISFYLNQCLIIIFLLNLLFGGDDLFAYQKNIYELTIKKVDGGRTTTFLAIASSEYEAKENVSLNGWKIIDIKLYKKFNSTEDNLSTKSSSTIYGIQKKLKYKNNTNEYDKDLKLVTYFDFAKYETNLKNNILAKLRKLNKDKKYLVYGHTDSVPVNPKTKEFKNNYELSMKRANFIKDKMVKILNIPRENIKVVGLGQMFPQVSNKLKGTYKNRRVEIYEYTSRY